MSAVVCPPGFDCSFAHSCPSFISSCPVGFLCSTYETLADKYIETADSHYDEFKFGFKTEKVFPEPGRYIQASCIKGFYCPNATTIYSCPEGAWCPEGSVAPIDCSSMSVCSSTSYFQINFINFLIMSLLTVLIASLSIYLKIQQSTKEKTTRSLGVTSSAGRTRYTAMPVFPDGVEMSDKSLVDSAESGQFRDYKGIQFNFKNLVVTVPSIPVVHLLDDVSGSLEAGKITCILGPSGCGKTSLFQALMRTRTSIDGDKSNDKTQSGTIDVTFQPQNEIVSGSQRIQRIGCVPQDDVIDRNLTVRELLEFNAYARIKGASKLDVDTRVREVLMELAISQIADTIIGGGENRSANISGGQLKRVSIACELVVLERPAALLLDEPTAGLDSSVAEELLKSLTKLTQRGVTVGVILQQPRPEIFNSLDKLFLMIPGGKIVFEGPPMSAASYLASYGFVQKEETSDADFCIDVLNKICKQRPALWQCDSTSMVVNGIDDLAVVWKQRSQSNSDFSDLAPIAVLPTEESPKSTQSSQDFRVVLLQAQRALKVRLRNVESLVIYASLSFIMAASLSSGFSILIQGSYLKTLQPPVESSLQAYYPSPLKNISERNTMDIGFQQLLFFMSSALGTASSLAAVPLFNLPWSLVRREDVSGISVLSYAIGRLLADLLNVVWIAFMFLGVWLLFGHPGSWLSWIAVIVCTAFASSGLGYVSSVISSRGYSSTLSILLTFICCVFSGVTPTLVQVKNLYVANWIWYISFATWTAEATYFTWTEYLVVDQPWLAKEVTVAASQYGYKIESLGRSLGLLIALGIFWRLLAALILYYRVKHIS